MIQFSFAFIEGEGLKPLEHNLINVGHKEFLKNALKINSSSYIIEHYKEITKKSHDGFLESKPPGTLLFYFLTKKITHFFYNKNQAKDNTLENITLFTSIVWTFMSLFVILPLYIFTKKLFTKDLALRSSVFFISIPSVNLVTMHLDQVLYPFLFICLMLIALLAIKNKSLFLQFFSGIFLYYICFFTFGLFASIPFVVQILFLHTKKISTFLTQCFCFFCGFFVCHFLFYIMFSYDTYENFTYALSHSKMWNKASEFNSLEILHSTKINFFEFFIFLGIPISFLFILSLFQDTCCLFTKEKTQKNKSILIFSLGVLSVIFLMQIIQRNTGEVIRLWLFLTPLVAIRSSYFIEKMWTSYKPLIYLIFILLQWFCTVLIKVRHDF